MHGMQSRRCLSRKVDGPGGLITQFYTEKTGSAGIYKPNGRDIAYTTHGPRAPSTFGDQVPSTAAPALIALANAHVVPIQLVVFGSERGLLLEAM